MDAHYRLPTLLSFALAVALAISAAGALSIPAVYARESALWAAQGAGQDWVDLLLVAPALALAAWFTRRGSRRAALLLAGILAYALYSLVLYAFFIHFGPLFFAHAWGLGLAFYGLVGLVTALSRDDVPGWFGPDAPLKTAGGLSLLLGLFFYALWLAEIVPALASGQMPKSAVETGLITNPIHVLDVGIVLPAFVVGGRGAHSAPPARLLAGARHAGVRRGDGCRAGRHGAVDAGSGPGRGRPAAGAVRRGNPGHGGRAGLAAAARATRRVTPPDRSSVQIFGILFQ